MIVSHYNTYGSGAVLSIKNTDIPQPGKNQVLVRLEASTVNRSDCAMLTGSPWIMRLGTGLFKPKEPILGTDLCGSVEALGDLEEGHQIELGDRILSFDDGGLQSHAEYALFSVKKPYVRLPENIDPKKAAAGIEGFHYARNFINKIDPQRGMEVLINGGTGAIGSAMVQLFVDRGLIVTATCKKEDFDRVRKLGVEHLIAYDEQDFTELDQRFDYVMDAVGKSSYFECSKLLKPNGIYISSELGPYVSNLWLSLFGIFRSQGKRVRFPYPADIGKSLEEMLGMLRENSFDPMIDRAFPLQETAAAFDYVLSGQKKGAVLLHYPTDLSP